MHGIVRICGGLTSLDFVGSSHQLVYILKKLPNSTVLIYYIILQN